MSTVIDVIFDGEVLRPQAPLNLKPNAHYSVTIEDAVAPPAPIRNVDPHKRDSARQALSDAAWAIYNTRLKVLLEPDYIGQVVAIHPDSGDYEVARSSPLAWKPLKKRHPEGLIAVLDIGPVPVHNALSLRNAGFSACPS